MSGPDYCYECDTVHIYRIIWLRVRRWWSRLKVTPAKVDAPDPDPYPTQAPNYGSDP